MRRAQDPEYAKKIRDRYVKRNPEKYRESVNKRLERQRTNPLYRVWALHFSASERNYSWALPDEQAVDLLTDNCFYCGKEPSPLNGIDRVDNLRGYEENNVVTSCVQCNRAKHTRTREDFEQWAIRVARHVQRT